MADETKELISPDSPPPEQPKKERRRKRVLISNDEDRIRIGERVISDLEQDIQSIDERLNLRMERYSKLHGWLPEKSWPYKDCANFWLPVMLIYSLKTKSTLENAVKSMRPVMAAKALKRGDQSKQEKIDHLLDYQVFVENRGEKKIDAYISNFVDDEAVFAFVHWVRKQENYRDIRVLPPLDENFDPLPQLAMALAVVFPTLDTERGTAMKDEDGWEWEVEFFDEENERKRARVEYYERDDGKLEAHIAYEATTYDGPVLEVLDLEDIVFPPRSGSLQPPGPDNPYGAPRVSRICKLSVDAIRRGMENRTYDLLTEEDFERIKTGPSVTNTGKPEEQPKEQKDVMEGRQVAFGSESGDDRQVIENYGRWDLDGDGLEEDVIFWVERNSKALMKAAYLSEMYPGLPIRRPFASESFIPIPNRIYGISLPELLESLQDIMQMLLNQHIDWGTIVNVPWFFYRAGSGMKPEVIRLQPGEGYPLDDPSRDVHFPTFAQRGEAYTINTMTVLQQFAERLAMISDVQFGRVPTGKASALRTVGTTVSLIAQGDARSEQVLRRLFHGLADVYHMIHRLNRRYLPERKEIRIAGIPEQGQDAYTEVGRDDIQASIDFEFKATMLNANKQVLSENLREAIALTISPIAVQAGLVTEQEIYELFRDKYRAVDLDPDKYLVRPPNYGPKLLAEEALSLILDGKPPFGNTLEPPEEHLQKLTNFETTPQVGFLTPETLPLYQTWKANVQGIITRRQMLMQASAMGMGGGGEGPGGVPTTMNGAGATENPPVQNNEFVDETVGRVQ